MKRIGLIAYSNNSGLGAIASSFREYLNLDSQLVIRHPVKGTHDIDISHTFGDIEATEAQLTEYLDTCDPEVVIVVETPFNFDFFQIMHDRGIKVVLIPMIDSIGVDKFLPYEEYIDLVINFTQVGHKIYLDKWQGSGIRLPYPIDTDYFNPDEAAKLLDSPSNAMAYMEGGKANIDTSPDVQEYLKTSHRYTFAHSEGWGGAGYRKSTDLVQTVYQQLYNTYKDMSISLTSQRGESAHSQLRPPKGQTFITPRELPEAIDLYRGCAIFVAPSRREGLGLPILEAMACGLPVITTNASPMNEWFPEDYPLLVEVQSQTDLPYGDVPMYTLNAFALMKKMEYAYKNPKLMEQIGTANSIIIQDEYSWNVLRDRYLDFLNR